MTQIGLLQILFFLCILLLMVKPLGKYMANIYLGKPTLAVKIGWPIERAIYRLCGVNPLESMDWKKYLTNLLLFNILGLFLVYFLQRLQGFLPLNPEHFTNVPPFLAFNTAISFVTNTNWQAYGGETTLSYLTQMLGLTVQNFVSAATGLSIGIAFIRGLTTKENTSLGNCWVDMTRSILYILLPLAILLSTFLISQGVIQNFKPYQTAHTLEQSLGTPQLLPMGPAASQIAIKQLGSNGGGFFNVNSAHPFENPTPWSNFFEMLALVAIPAALCYTFGIMVKDRKQGWALFFALFLLFIPVIFFATHTEQTTNPQFIHLGIASSPINDLYPGANLEGKETRFGINGSVLWSVATNAGTNGAVNASIDSFMPLTGGAVVWIMHLGEASFGGLGVGLSGALLLVIITAFIAGLMVGRTPEFLGKKIEPFEMKMATISLLIMPLIVLLFTAIAVVTPSALSSLGNPGPHGFTEILYAFTSSVKNNGSAFQGLNANTPFFNLFTGIAMLIGRFWLAIPTLAIAGSLARKKIIPHTSGTLPTNDALFVILLMSVGLVIGALAFLPALCLGPIVEHLMIWKTI